MPNGCFKGKHRTRDYTAEYWRISAISFKPIFKAELGQYVFISGILSKHHQRYKVIWVDDGLAVVEFCFDRKKLSVSLVLDNRSASNKLYIVCPHCKTRRQHLYAASNTYACRGCLKLHYLSQSERCHVRLRQKMRNQRKKIWGEDWPGLNNLFENAHSWPKPKGLHWKTFFKGLDELDKLERQYWPNVQRQLDVMLKRKNII